MVTESNVYTFPIQSIIQARLVLNHYVDKGLENTTKIDSNFQLGQNYNYTKA